MIFQTQDNGNTYDTWVDYSRPAAVQDRWWVPPEPGPPPLPDCSSIATHWPKQTLILSCHLSAEHDLQCLVYSTVADLDPHGSALIWVAGSRSGSRGAKMTNKNWKKYRIFMFWSARCSLLRAEGFSCSLGVLYGGLGISKLQFLILIKKIKIKFPAVKFFQF